MAVGARRRAAFAPERCGYVDEIVEIVRKGPLPDAADELVRRAVERMTQSSGDEPSKPDDLTVMLFRKKRPAKT